MTKYEDASWHTEGEFPDDLPESAAATHIGMLLSWCVMNGYASDDLKSHAPISDLQTKSSKLSPGYFCLILDGKFTEEEVTPEIRDFLESYTDPEDGAFYEDYEIELADDLESIYHVPDTWKTYEVAAKFISRAYKEYQEDLD